MAILTPPKRIPSWLGRRNRRRAASCRFSKRIDASACIVRIAAHAIRPQWTVNGGAAADFGDVLRTVKTVVPQVPILAQRSQDEPPEAVSFSCRVCLSRYSASATLGLPFFSGVAALIHGGESGDHGNPLS